MKALRYGVVSRLDARDRLWMLRQFRSTLEEARTAARDEAAKLLDLGWQEAELRLVTFDGAVLARFERYRGLADAPAGEVAIGMREPELGQLGIKVIPGEARKARELAA